MNRFYPPPYNGYKGFIKIKTDLKQDWFVYLARLSQIL